MLDTETKRRIDSARDILVGKVPDPKSQVEQITIALIYKFMDDMDMGSEELGGERSFFRGEFEKYAWRKIFDPRMGGFEILALYSEAIIKMNVNPNIPQLFRDIFKNAYLPYRDPETLKAFLKIINEFNYDHSEKLGDAFEYLLSVLGSQGEAGQFRTPRHIIDFMVAIVDPKKDEIIMDPACGTAGFLISSYKHIIKNNSSNYNPEKDTRMFETKDLSLSEIVINSKNYKGDKLTPDERNRLANNIKGYDISPDMVRLSLVNMYLHGLHAPHINEYDTLTSEDNWNEYADVILANPPFMSPKGGIRPHKRFSITSNRSEVLFVDYIAEHLTPDGRAAVIVPEGIIFQSGTAYKSLRKMLVEKYLVGVISLPAGVFNPYSGVKTSILWLDRTLAKRTDKILFVKINNDGFDLGAQRRPIKHNDLPFRFNSLVRYKETLLNQSPYIDGDEDVFVTLKADISKSEDYNLSAERYRVKQYLTNSQWKIIKLKEVILDMKDGGTPSRSNPDYFGGNVNWCVVKDIKPRIFETTEKLTELGLKNSSAKVWPIDSIIISLGATIGNVGIAKVPTATKQGLSGIITDKNKITPEFLYYILLTSKKTIQSFASGVTIKEVRPSKLQNLLQFPLPPLSVQKEIVAEIESYQKIIDGARQVVENYKPRIDIDPEWPMVELGEIADITSSKRIFQEEYVTEGTPFYRTKEVVELSKGLPISLELFIPHSRYEQIKQKFDVPKKGEILLSAVGTIGISWVIEDDREFYFKDGNLLWIKNIKNAVPEYIKAALDHCFMTELDKMIYGAAYKALTIVKLKELKIPFPGLDKQNQIVGKYQEEWTIIKANKRLIEIFEQKINDRIAKVWGERKSS